MILKYSFFYTNTNNILGYFLDFYAKQSGIEFCIKDNEKDEISLLIKAEEAEILNFNDNFIKFIPNSIFLDSTKVEICNEFFQNNYKFDKNFLPNFSPKSLEIFKTTDKISKNEFEILSDIQIFDETFIKINEENFDKYLQFCIQNLLENKIIKIKNSYGEFEISVNINFDSDFLMPTNLKNLHKVAICDEKTTICLQSFEKPLIKLKINSLFLQNHPQSPKFFDFKSSSDIFTYALINKISKQNINFLSFKCIKKFKENLKILVLENKIVFIKNPFLSTNFKNFLEKKTDKNLALFGLILKEFQLLENDVIKVFLSKAKQDEIKFINKNKEFDFLKIKIPSSFEELKILIQNSENGERLLENFEKKFVFPKGEIKNSQNFYSLFKIIKEILNFKFEIFENANLFLGQKGPRLDYKILGKNEFDIVKFVKSGMSFTLAGVDETTLSFGYAESLCFFISDIIDDIKSNFNVTETVCFGEIFSQKAFCNLVLKHVNLPQNVRISNFLPLEFDE